MLYMASLAGCNGRATFPSWSQCKKNDKFDGHHVHTIYGAGSFRGEGSCDLEKVTTCAMDASYSHKSNQFYSEFLHGGNVPRLTCIRKSGSSFLWNKASIHIAHGNKFEGSDPKKAKQNCLDGGADRWVCEYVTRQAYALAKVECMRILTKY